MKKNHTTLYNVHIKGQQKHITSKNNYLKNQTENDIQGILDYFNCGDELSNVMKYKYCDARDYHILISQDLYNYTKLK